MNFSQFESWKLVHRLTKLPAHFVMFSRMAIKIINSKGKNTQWNIQKTGPMRCLPKDCFAAIVRNNATRTIERFPKQTGLNTVMRGDPFQCCTIFIRSFFFPLRMLYSFLSSVPSSILKYFKNRNAARPVAKEEN